MQYSYALLAFEKVVDSLDRFHPGNLQLRLDDVTLGVHQDVHQLAVGVAHLGRIHDLVATSNLPLHFRNIDTGRFKQLTSNISLKNGTLSVKVFPLSNFSPFAKLLDI